MESRTGDAVCDVGVMGDAQNVTAPTLMKAQKESVQLPTEIVNKVAEEQDKSAEVRIGSPIKSQEQYILSMDVGTTNIRGHVYTKKAHLMGSASKQQKILQPKPGWFELDPNTLFQDVVQVAKDCISAAGLQPQQITCMGITTMRATFVTWDRDTGEPFHNFISWQDLRAADYVTAWNKSYTMRTFSTVAKLLHLLLRKKRYLAASVLQFMTKQVTMRLLWALDNFPAMEWSSVVCGMLNIPTSIFPVTNDTSGDFGVTDFGIFGCPIPITAVVADQQGAMFGQCCFEVGDVKCTMGTGTFLDLNTGDQPHASIADSGGVYFVPAFSGLQTPFNDDKAVTTLFGLNPTTTRAHIVRAVLESLAFRFKALYETVFTETKIPFSCVRVDGGVTNNNFLVQLMADLVDQTIDRSQHVDMTCLGAAFLAGLAKGIWKGKDELLALRKSGKVFQSQRKRNHLKPLYHQWENAVRRTQNWYP